MPKQYDVIIIGAGVVGAMTARFLARYDLDILWIEKEADICTGATAANSALIHGGYDAVPGSLKAEMNVKGNAMWTQLSEELDFGFERIGTYVVAIGAEELPALEELKTRGDASGVPVEIISAEEMKRREPHINSDVSGALVCPSGGICDPWGATIAAAENAVTNGVELKLNTKFEDFLWEDAAQKQRIVGIRTNQGDFHGRWVVNAAGLYADMVMHQAGVRPEFEITARRGEYYVMDRNQVQVNNVLFPVPTEVSKGILVTNTLHGNVLVGPNAEEIEDKTNVDVTPDGMKEIWAGAQKLVPSLEYRDVIAVFAGLRPGGNAPCQGCEVEYHKDFIIEIPDEVEGLVNLGGIESPGLTAAPAIAVRVTELLREAGEELRERSRLASAPQGSTRLPPHDARGAGRAGGRGPALRAHHLPLRVRHRRRNRGRNPRAHPRDHLRRHQAPYVAGHRALSGRFRYAARGRHPGPRAGQNAGGDIEEGGGIGILAAPDEGSS